MKDTSSSKLMSHPQFPYRDMVSIMFSEAQLALTDPLKALWPHFRNFSVKEKSPFWKAGLSSSLFYSLNFSDFEREGDLK